MKKLTIIALGCMLLCSGSSQAADSQVIANKAKNFIKASSIGICKALHSACVKTKIIAYEKPVAVATGMAVTGGLAYGLYRLLFWYFHIPDKLYLVQANRFYTKTTVKYHDILEQLKLLKD